MEQFFANPGLNHIGRKILMEVGANELVSTCTKVCIGWKCMLDEPMFWMDKSVKHFSTTHETPPEIVISLWKRIWYVSQYSQTIINLLQNMINSEKSFRNPIYMIFKKYPSMSKDDITVLKTILSIYHQEFLEQTSSSCQSLRNQAISPLNDMVIDCILTYFSHHRHNFPFTNIAIRFAEEINTNSRIMSLLNFYLEYIVANFQGENLTFYYGYDFLYTFLSLIPESNQITRSYALKMMINVMDNFVYFTNDGSHQFTKTKSIYHGMHNFCTIQEKY